MKKILLIPLLSSLAFAKSADSCYSVQLKSFYLKKHSTYSFERAGYPRNCKLIKFSKIYSVRCGCFDRYAQAQRELDKLSDRYYDAMIVETYRYRFSDTKEEDSYETEYEKQDNNDIDGYKSRLDDDKYEDELDAYLAKKLKERKRKAKTKRDDEYDSEDDDYLMPISKKDEFDDKDYDY